MQAVTDDTFTALRRWHAAYRSYERQACEPMAAAELIQASQALAACVDEESVGADQRRDVERWAAEGGRGA